MCTFEVAMERCMCFMRSTFRLVQVVKWPFLIAWSNFFFTGLNIVAWYHLDRYILILAVRSLSSSGCFLLGRWSGLLVMLTCHMSDVFDQLPSNTVSPSFTTVRLLAVKVYMHASFQHFHIDMRAPACRWGNMWDVRADWVKRGFIFSSALWVACMMLPSSRMNWGHLLIGYLLLHGVFTLM